MPVVKISAESMALLIAEARNLKISVKDLLDAIIDDFFSEEVEEAEEIEEEPEETEEEE